MHDSPAVPKSTAKSPPVIPRSSARQSSSRIYTSLFLLLVALFSAYGLAQVRTSHFLFGGLKPDIALNDLCPQSDPLSSTKHKHVLERVEEQTASKGYKDWVYDNLRGAVRIPTETYDDLGKPGEDDRWDSRLQLHDYLRNHFPLVHKHLQRTIVNHYGLVFHWQGSNKNSKPILLTGHQDVVPIDNDTRSQWHYPPYDADFEDGWIWGRGSIDDKASVTSILNAVETLLKNDFKPSRSVVVALGMDEERSGKDGGPAMRDYLLSNYGREGFAFLVDEGCGMDAKNDALFANICVSEKGMEDIRIEVHTPGGHSMIPPRHTSIGLLSMLISELEMHPLPSRLLREGIYFRSLECGTAHDPGVSPHIRDLVMKGRTNDKALRQLQDALQESNEVAFRAMTSTTQAFDIIGGGVKVNALPTSAFAIANHRIADWSSLVELENRYVELLSPLTVRLNLSFEAFEKTIRSKLEPSAGHLRVSKASDSTREPAPISPTAGHAAYDLLAGTILATLESSQLKSHRNRTAAVQPSITIGNTDTGYYWDLTKNIFRYVHLSTEDMTNGMHSVNEAIRAEGYVEISRFYSRLILNADESDLLDET